ncbi:hypothetical protein JCM8097_004486 [Rhodosporidiobolus ruineniae]
MPSNALRRRHSAPSIALPAAPAHPPPSSSSSGSSTRVSPVEPALPGADHVPPASTCEKLPAYSPRTYTLRLPPFKPLAAKPSPPALLVPLTCIPALLSWGPLASFLLPHFDPMLRLQHVTPSSSPPTWSLSLESHYQVFNRNVWPLLRAVHEREREYALDLMRWAWQRGQAGASEAEILDIGREVVSRIQRLLERFVRLYGLHHVRELFLTHARLSGPEKTHAQLIAETELGTLGFSAHPVDSLWPLLVPVPSDPATPIVTSLTLASSLSNQQLSRYKLPDVDSLYSSQLKDIVESGEGEAPPAYCSHSRTDRHWSPKQQAGRIAGSRRWWTRTGW